MIRRLISQGPLDAPWGLVRTPGKFGQFSHALLVGNVGNGYINAFDFKTGAFLGTLKNKDGQPISNTGLWGLTFGNDGKGVTRRRSISPRASTATDTGSSAQ